MSWFSLASYQNHLKKAATLRHEKTLSSFALPVVFVGLILSFRLVLDILTIDISIYLRLFWISEFESNPADVTRVTILFSGWLTTSWGWISSVNQGLSINTLKWVFFLLAGRTQKAPAHLGKGHWWQRLASKVNVQFLLCLTHDDVKWLL